MSPKDQQQVIVTGDDESGLRSHGGGQHDVVIRISTERTGKRNRLDEAGLLAQSVEEGGGSRRDPELAPEGELEFLQQWR